jgi:hypothetical protein
MQKTKIVIALVIVAALTLAIVGFAAAQITSNQTYSNPDTNPNAIQNGGFFGWMGRCFGFRSNQPYSNQYVAPQNPTNTQIPAPNSGSYYGYGPCMGRW